MSAVEAASMRMPTAFAAGVGAPRGPVDVHRDRRGRSVVRELLHRDEVVEREAAREPRDADPMGAIDRRRVGGDRSGRLARSTTYQVSIAPLPLTSTVPRGVQTNSSFSRSYVARVIWNSPGEPWLSIRLAVLTASPHRSYRNRFDPMTPATTGPELMPIRSSRPSPSTTGEPATVSRMSSASDAARRA